MSGCVIWEPWKEASREIPAQLSSESKYWLYGVYPKPNIFRAFLISKLWEPFVSSSPGIEWQPLTALPSFVCRCWGLNLSPHTHKASTVLTKVCNLRFLLWLLFINIDAMQCFKYYIVLSGLCSPHHDLVVFHLVKIKVVSMRKLSYVLRPEGKNYSPTWTPEPSEHRPETGKTSVALGLQCD